jgi:Uma2 family endonuclease
MLKTMSYALNIPGKPTYADIQALPPHVVGEILDGELVVRPRPALSHSVAASRLGALLGPPFDLGLGGPGGWWIVDEPELSLGIDPRFDPVVPDLAGWRITTIPERLIGAQAHVPPDWICEVLSPSTQRHDRVLKLPFYARARVGHVWLIDPLAETLEVYGRQGEHWLLLGSHGGDETVQAAPFHAIDLSLTWLWGREPAPAQPPPDAPDPT